MRKALGFFSRKVFVQHNLLDIQTATLTPQGKIINDIVHVVLRSPSEVIVVGNASKIMLPKAQVEEGISANGSFFVVLPGYRVKVVLENVNALSVGFYIKGKKE